MEQETVQQDVEEDFNKKNCIIFESRFMKFVLLFVKNNIFCQNNSKIV